MLSFYTPFPSRPPLRPLSFFLPQLCTYDNRIAIHKQSYGCTQLNLDGWLATRPNFSQLSSRIALVYQSFFSHTIADPL